MPATCANCAAPVEEGARLCAYCGRALPQPDRRERLALLARGTNEQLKHARGEAYQGRLQLTFLGLLGAGVLACLAIWQSGAGWPLRLLGCLAAFFGAFMTFGFAVVHYEGRGEREAWERGVKDELLERLAELDVSTLELAGLAAELLGEDTPLVRCLRAG